MATFTRFALSVLLLQLGFTDVSQAGSIQHGHKRHTINHASLHKRALTITNNLPTNWTYSACYTEGSGVRALASKSYTNTSGMTQESCTNFCSTAGYFYAGVEYSQECYCGNTFSGGAAPASNQGDCNMACTGNSAEACGGPDRLNVFHNNVTLPPAPPATNAGPAGWGFLGCYTDSVNARTLPNGVGVPGGGNNMTVALCTQACQAQNYNISGVEYSGECYCGNSFMNGGAPAPDGLTGCNMPCNGNSSELCGGANRLDVYALGVRSVISPAWSTLGCYTDSVQSRTLTVGMNVVGGAQNMTIENCQAACNAANYNISGVEYSGECYCDNSFQNGGGPAPDGNAKCNMPCNGNSNEICGGPDRLDVFSYIGPPPPTGGIVSVTSTTASTTAKSTSTSTSVTGSTTASTTTTTSATPTPTTAAPGIGNFTYQGCWVDNTYGRILVSQTIADNNMTIEECVTDCQQEGYSIAGLEYSTQCNCGNAIINGGYLGKDSDCAMTCGGNSSEICGGPNRMSIYSSSSNFSTYAPPSAKNTSLPTGWSYQGCLQDVQTRTLPYELQMPTNLTVEYCLNLCGQFGYSAAGVEYGIQCFCGDDTDRINAGAQWLSASSCNMECTGSPTELCGGGNALNYYTQPPTQNWGQGVGNSAGSYQFLIGGVVIPLLTAANHNGKVAFVEKHGTGPPNSTGAYELDLSQINNFTAAWRTMNGLQTDVFCSASLILPDKGARQINIGGWSGTSTYGVRLYWPDGGPGVTSVNDWQENPNEVHLQTGRWYPSAMQLQNGSIVVVGGENGSNGPPVPNLEVLPPTGGGLVYCDWLNRTDPFNLYPFLAVLPSGNIFTAYYNEARILSPVDFSTLQTLPNIPGAVDNPAGGRTYPLEGTSMLLPLKAPYTDPLSVLICGGSTPGAGFALDNCVTIQPEVPGANWTIERMPNRRVITSMVALPDGTYLIMNGAQQGFAGFGLAQDPNLMALLYNPTQPLGSRITRLANTTIARLYHSEATLLMDGRVLISGSDPEDGVHPQEYRVEIFIPPYLMALNEPLALNSSNRMNPTVISPTASTNSSGPYSNATSTTNQTASATTCGQRPAFTIDNNVTTVSYGQSFTVTMLCGTASRFTLLGGVASTHGNSMGQRTIFPDWSCSGNSCTITAPPNGGITGGPMWFMLFVLDGNNVPGIASWIQIGGDPAGLGNWPNFPDFHLPGV